MEGPNPIDILANFQHPDISHIFANIELWAADSKFSCFDVPAEKEKAGWPPREKRRLVMHKKLKELATEATVNQLQLVRITNESANQIRLAGLGAFSKAQQEGGKKFEALVAEGEKVQERMKVAADERLTELREKATGAWDKLEKAFEDRVARALHTLNVPSRQDIDTLSKQVHELTVTKKLSEEENLSEEGETRVHGRAHRAKAA